MSYTIYILRLYYTPTRSTLSTYTLMLIIISFLCISRMGNVQLISFCVYTTYIVQLQFRHIIGSTKVQFSAFRDRFQFAQARPNERETFCSVHSAVKWQSISIVLRSVNSSIFKPSR